MLEKNPRCNLVAVQTDVSKSNLTTSSPICSGERIVVLQVLKSFIFGPHEDNKSFTLPEKWRPVLTSFKEVEREIVGCIINKCLLLITSLK